MGSIPKLSILKGCTKPLPQNLIYNIFENIANTCKDETALIFEDDTNDTIVKYTYEQLDNITNRFAKTIIEYITINNIPRNTDGDYIIAVNMRPSEKLIIVLLSIWKSGGAYLPLDHEFPGNRIEHIINEAKPVIVIYDEDKSDHYLDRHAISFQELMHKSESTSEKSVGKKLINSKKDDLAIVLYTSGSTGIPKGVRIPHQVILNRLQWQFKKFPYNTSERACIFKTALTFVDSVAEIWGPLINGLTLVIIPKDITRDPEKLIGILDRYKIERLVLVPSLLKSILLYLKIKTDKTVLEKLKLWVSSGETLTVSLAREFYEYFPGNKHILCNFYGSTEIMGDVTYHIIEESRLSAQEKIPIGTPVDNTVIYLLDKDFRPVKVGDVGELYVSGLNLAAGYVRGRDPEKFISNPLAFGPTYNRLYRTGDFARMQNDLLIYEGRTDSQVKIRGNRVDLSEVEKAVNSIDEVEKGVVLCYKPGELNQALLAFVKSVSLVNEHQIETILKGKLNSYMVPQVILVDKIPLLVNGKTDRQALLKIYENTNNNDDLLHPVDIDYVDIPKNQMAAAKVLFETVASVLSRSTRGLISKNSNFYEIGGNSLNSIYTITELHSKGYYISIADFISAIDLGEILSRMTSGTIVTSKAQLYTSELLSNEHKEVVISMITSSFYYKADLEQWIISEISLSDYEDLLNEIWEPLVEKSLSFVLKSDLNKIVGVTLNFDAHDEPEVEIRSKLNVIFEFLEAVEGPIRDNMLPVGKGKVLHAFMMATHSSLSSKENVVVMQAMETEVLNLAKLRGFNGILTTNTSPLTQQLGTDVYKYETLLVYQINKYTAVDNTKPFKMAPDEQIIKVQWKPLN